MFGPILVLGGTGMLGHKVWQVLRCRFETHIAARSSHGAYADLGIFDADRWHADVEAGRFESLLPVVADVRPAAIVNCIGVIKQRAAAQNPLEAIPVNSLFPHRLHQLSRELGAHLIHISTDCVFSGERGNYSEDDSPDPPDLYGRSKLLGEVDGPGALTLRTSVIGRELRTSYGLVEWFLRQDGRRVAGYANAIYSGLSTFALAEVISELLSRDSLPSGLYHVASTPISKHDLLLLLRDAFGMSVEIERDEQFHCDRSLNGGRFRATTGILVPTWAEMVAEMAGDPTPYRIGGLTPCN